MRLLVVTNLYPPYHIGGYELGCRDVVETLRARGHAVQVLTSTFRVGPELPPESGVERTLHFVTSSAPGKSHTTGEKRVLMRALRRYRPEVVYFWNQAGLSLWLPAVARALGYRVAFFLSDTNFVSWRIGAVLARWVPPVKNPVVRALRSLFHQSFLVQGHPIIENQACHFASRFLQTCAQRAGIKVAAAISVVAHWGIALNTFARARGVPSPPRRLLYVGQMIPQKGVHTAIAALALLGGKGGGAMSLTIAGDGLEPEYEQTLRDLPLKLGVAERVRFLGRVPRGELPLIYTAHDVLIFPSEWDEPFAITPLEAIAAGLAVVGTGTGGSGELLRDRETAMVFPAGDAAACAAAIRTLAADPELHRRICRQAAAEVAEHHTLSRMVETIEHALHQV